MLALLCSALLACPASGPLLIRTQDDPAARLDDYLTRCRAFGFSGSVVVERRGEVLLAKGYGLAQAGARPVPNTPETLYDIASVSKSVTAAAILLLEARGELSISDSIAEHLPDVPKQHRRVTLEHLLSHTSGFPRKSVAGSGPDRAAAVAKYLSARREHKEGKRFEYYNGGFALLAAVVEEVTGESFEDWVRANLFAPAGMERAGFVEDPDVDASLLAAAAGGQGKLTTDYIRGWGYKGMGGVLCSATELARWFRALDQGLVLPEEQLEAMRTQRLEQYALGLYAFETEGGRRVVQHGGSAAGFHSYARHFLDDDVVIVVLANCEGWCWQVTWGLAALLLKGEDPKAPAPPELVEWPRERTAEVCRVWNGTLGALIVEDTGDGLIAGGFGIDLIDALSPGVRRGRAPGKSPDAKGLARASEVAMTVVEELRAGRTTTLERILAPHIPESWPNTVREMLWPAHLEQWGRVRGHRLMGSYFDPDSKRLRVWIELDHARGKRSVEVAFVDDQLAIFDLKAPRYPLVIPVAPIADDVLASFDFGERSALELHLSGREGSRRLEAVTASGKGHRFD